MKDTVCICGHWFEEHFTDDGEEHCEGCWVGGTFPDVHPFQYDADITVVALAEQEF